MHLQDAAQAVLNARDFCGNEAQALRDWESENWKLTEYEKFKVFQIVQEEWKTSKP